MEENSRVRSIVEDSQRMSDANEVALLLESVLEDAINLAQLAEKRLSLITIERPSEINECSDPVRIMSPFFNYMRNNLLHLKTCIDGVSCAIKNAELPTHE